MIKDLPQSLLDLAKLVVETQEILESCTSCGAVKGSCIHTDGIQEDSITTQDIPSDEEPDDELSGEKEEVVINPEYKTSLMRRPI